VSFSPLVAFLGRTLPLKSITISRLRSRMVVSALMTPHRAFGGAYPAFLNNFLIYFLVSPRCEGALASCRERRNALGF